jgi:hypothetical protein
MPQSKSKPKGLKVEIVLWHMKGRENFTSRHAHLWIRGDITRIDDEAKPKRTRLKFNDAGKLLTILGNAEKFRKFRKKK